MQFSKIIIDGYKQFGLLDLDLTYGKSHSKAGQPLEKVCLIGSNGTGKSTLLRLFYQFWNGDPENQYKGDFFENHPILGEWLLGPRRIFVRFIRNGVHYEVARVSSRILFAELDEDWSNSLLPLFKSTLADQDRLGHIDDLQLLLKEFTDNSTKRFTNVFTTSESLLFIYSPAESKKNPMLSAGPFPETNLNNALTYFEEFPHHHRISFEDFEEFWNLVIYQVKKRENDRVLFENKPENLDKSKRQLIHEFERNNPDFLKALSEKWNLILSKANLYFDYKDAKLPIQLTENLEAFIKVKDSNWLLEYSKLSSGIRHLLLRLGYLLALYYKRDIQSAIALIDEPENSLFPSILYDLIKVYTDTAPNTQFFFATHSPIIASQFHPDERIILEFDEQGKVEARKGVSPEGDDPNDVLIQDFGLENILGKKGLEKLQRYIELKTLIKNEPDPAHKDQLVKEYLEIGNQYHFGNEAYS
jgi:energy-coupling factor transporter ATP-binding protein EcfA2